MNINGYALVFNILFIIVVLVGGMVVGARLALPRDPVGPSLFALFFVVACVPVGILMAIVKALHDRKESGSLMRKSLLGTLIGRIALGALFIASALFAVIFGAQ